MDVRRTFCAKGKNICTLLFFYQQCTYVRSKSLNEVRVKPDTDFVSGFRDVGCADHTERNFLQQREIMRSVTSPLMPFCGFPNLTRPRYFYNGIVPVTQRFIR